MPARARLLPARQADAMAELADLLAAMAPDELEAFAGALPAEDVALLEHVMAEAHAVGWRADPASMGHHLQPDQVTLWRYVRLLSQRFVDAIEGRSTRQIWNLPARMSKTTMLRWGIVWALDRRPDGRSMWVSYGDMLAMESATSIRDILRAHRADLRAQLKRDRQQADRFLTPEGGGLIAGGLSTSLTGFGVSEGGVLIVDDPFKNWQEAHSEAARNRIFDAFKGTLRNRLDLEEAPIIICHHRVHTDDLTGRLVAEGLEGGEQWEVTAIPALATGDPDDPLGRAEGEVIEPERFTLEAVHARHRGMGSSYLVSALEQQNPAAPEGKELLREWFVLADASELPRTPELAITSWDLKLKDREAGDYVVGQCWWTSSGGYWLMDQLRGQYDHATTANAIALLSVRHPEARTHIIEAAGSSDEVIPQLRKPIDGYTVTDGMALRLGMTVIEREAVGELRRRGMANLVAHPPKGDKSVRARAFIAPAAEPGLVRMPADAPFVAGILDELSAFPTGVNDDQVDAMSQALQRLTKGGASVKAASGAVPAPRAGAHRAAAPVARGSVQVPSRASIMRPSGRLPSR